MRRRKISSVIGALASIFSLASLASTRRSISAALALRSRLAAYVPVMPKPARARSMHKWRGILIIGCVFYVLGAGNDGVPGIFHASCAKKNRQDARLCLPQDQIGVSRGPLFR